MNSNFLKLKCNLGCKCARRNERGFCNTHNCPVYSEFTNVVSLVDYFSLGMKRLDISVELFEVKNKNE